MIDRAAQTKTFDRQAMYEDAVLSLLLKLQQVYAAHIFIFVQCYGPSEDHDDRRVARRLYESLRQQSDAVTLMDGFENAQQIKTAYKAMDMLIGSRMHTAIFALSDLLPVLLIGYQPKARGVMESFGVSHYCCEIETVTGDRLYDLARELVENRQALSEQIAERFAVTMNQLRTWPIYLEG